MTRIPDNNRQKTTTYANFSRQERHKMCRRLMTGEPQMEQLIVKHFSPADYFAVSDRLIGTGLIGGKACGLLLGRKLIDTYLPETAKYLEPHDSFYIGTDVFYRYMVENECWPQHVRHQLKKKPAEKLDSFREALARGSFPDAVREQFSAMLKHYGNEPIIIRSSSVMEDGFGNAFSGKYESVFCTNQGSLEERLEAFENAVRTVYASTLSPAAIEYRKNRKLLGRDEQMALLVQRVAGTRHGELFFPMASGVGFSYNPYRWMEHINPAAGMLRLVAGMGTRAVNRTPGDYPRLVGLDRPQAMLWPTTRERHKYSQRRADVLNLSAGRLETRGCEDIFPLLAPAEQKYLFSHDTDAESHLKETGKYRTVFFTDCQGMINHPEFIGHMKNILNVLERSYECPVDIEFSLTALNGGALGINLLQCRPLQERKATMIQEPRYQPSEVLFEVTQASMRNSKTVCFDLIVMVDPRKYYAMPHHLKSRIAAAIGKINQALADKTAMLLVPGRIGTSSPELGVPVSYTEISRFQAICEISCPDAGYHPELSYGSHMFQDMVEADVFYAAIHDNHNTRLYQPELLSSWPDISHPLLADYPECRPVIQVRNLSGQPAALYLDAARGHALCLIHPDTAGRLIP